MGSYSGNCEIVEANDDHSPRLRSERLRRVEDRERKPPMTKKVPNKSLEEDINRLFDAINVRTSKSLDLSDRGGLGFSPRNASKKPMRSGPQSPGIGFSEPVSLKQAFRGLCISQAAEMAAMKRLSKPSGSPRVVPVSGNLTNMYRSVVVETGTTGFPLAEGKEGKIEISLVPEESTSYSSDKVLPYYVEPKMKSVIQSANSSPRFAIRPTFRSAESSLKQKEIAAAPIKVGVHSGPAMNIKSILKHNETETTPNEAEIEPVKTVPADEGSCRSTPTSFTPCHSTVSPVPEADKKVSGAKKISKAPKKSVSSIKVVNKATPKLRRKTRLHTVTSGAAKSSKDPKPNRNAPRAVKPVIKNKIVVMKKSKPESAPPSVSGCSSYEVTGALANTSNQLICHRCQCSLKSEASKEPPETPTPDPASPAAAASLNSTNCSSSKPGFVSGQENFGTPVVKSVVTSKSGEKGDFSQSSKSSIGEYSSSTSTSDESNLSGSSCGNRPHMSKDMRWEAISHIKKRHGFLGLSHFNLLRKLGSGDIGTVYLAELIDTNCLFAIKVMDNEFLARRKKMPRAQTEREILRMLDHPFLPTLYAQFTSDNLSCLVMEFCPGGDLHVLRQKQPGRYFPEQAARFYVAEVLLALEYLHMLGIVYRDLKPENIMVREDGHIMLTDFDLSLRCSVNPTLVRSSAFCIEPPRISGPCAGSNCIDPFCSGPSCQVSCFSPRLLPATARARKLKAEQAAKARSLPQLVAEPTEARSNSFVGTHEYLAPEIIKGEGHGSAVDWWTFGVFLYELLYGKTPFKGAGNEETLANVVMQNLKFPDTPIISFQARDLIRGLLVKEPENRLGTETGAAEIKRHPFFEGLNWALIRCAVPPELPDFCDIGIPKIASQEKGKKFLEYSATGEHLEFELF